MPWQSLPQLLQHLEQQPTWQQHSHFQKLLHHWPAVVGDLVAQQTRPITIRRGVLCVATASAVWAQNLSFERQRILAKLNPLLAHPLTDIHFSTAQWSDPSRGTHADRPEDQDHPSATPSSATPSACSPVIAPGAIAPLTPDTAFQHWRQRLQQQRQPLPLCPQCHCHTPPGELARWSVCALCARQTDALSPDWTRT